jgi:hypothetical protein
MNNIGRMPIMPADTSFQQQIAAPHPDPQTVAALQAKDDQLKQMQARFAELQYK